jgi:hypothetical protein
VPLTIRRALCVAALLGAACGTPPADVGCASDNDCDGGRCVAGTGVCVAWPTLDQGVPDLVEPPDLGAPDGEDVD